MPGEMKIAYQCLQNKYFLKNLLDIKARLILRKTQYNDTLSEWAKEKTSERCHMCQVRGDYSKGTLKQHFLIVIQ